MCQMTEEELLQKSDPEIVALFKRAIELNTKPGGNGHNPLDEKQLEEEVLRRMKSRHT